MIIIYHVLVCYLHNNIDKYIIPTSLYIYTNNINMYACILIRYRYIIEYDIL